MGKEMTKEQQLWTLNGNFEAFHRLQIALYDGQFKTTTDINDFIIEQFKTIDKRMTELEEELGIE